MLVSTLSPPATVVALALLRITGQPSLERLQQTLADGQSAAARVIDETLAALAPQIADFDVNLALEFNWSPVVKSVMSAVRVVEQVDNPKVGVLFDTAHYYVTPSKFEHLNADTVRWFKHVHLNDMADKPGDLCDCNADRVLPGEGVLDIPRIIRRKSLSFSVISKGTVPPAAQSASAQ